jgi:hypothetical protein
MTRTALLGYLLILLIGLGALLGHKSFFDKEFSIAKAHFIEREDKTAMAQARKLETALATIYQNIRTVSFLPLKKSRYTSTGS